MQGDLMPDGNTQAGQPQDGGSSGASADLPRFAPSGGAAAPPQPVWEPGVVEVEFRGDVRPQLTPTAAGATTGIQSPSAVDLSALNEVLQRHGLQRAEPSFLVTLQAADQAHGAALLRGMDVPHYANFVTLHFPPEANLVQIAQELRQLSEVVQAVPVPQALPPRVAIVDPLVGSTDQVLVDPNTGLEHQWYVFRCHADQAWTQSAGDNVVVADVDWGCRITHQDLVAKLDLTHMYNAYDGGTDITTGGSVFHGTGVLGLAGAANNGVGMTGMAFGATLWPIQADSGPGAPLGGNAWARGIEYVRTADSGGQPKVLILEVQTGSFGNYEMVPSVNAAIRTAIASGVVVCVAAGNGNRDAGLDDTNNPIPATGSILVGATAYDPASNPRAWFSNYGPRLVVSAPGDGSHDLTCDSTSDAGYRNNFGGTSGATPKVAATAALMLAANPHLSHAQISSLLNSTGTPVTTDPGKPVGTFLNCQEAVAQALHLNNGPVWLDGTPAVRPDAAGRLQLIVRGRPEAMQSNMFQLSQSAPNNGWSSWLDLGHGFEPPSPALATNADGRLEAFAQGGTGLFHRWETAPGAGWTAWAPMFVPLTAGTPSAGRNADGRLEVFTVTYDGAVRHAWQTAPDGGWSPLDVLGGSFTFPASSPVVSAGADGRLEVFVIAADGSLRHIWQQLAGGWSAWYSHGGSLSQGGVAVATNVDGRLEAFGIGTDGNLYHIWQTTPNGGWSGWSNLGGAPLGGPPALGANADGRLEAFAVATDGTLHHIWQMTPNGGWSGWASLGSAGGGFISSAAPGVGANADGRMEVFAIGADSNLYHAWQTAPNGGWSAWASFGRPSL
jgi:hypothetical protein